MISGETCSPRANGVKTETRWLRDAWPLVASGLLLLTFVVIPFAVVDTDADPSLSLVLNYAHEHGLQFGTEVVYTYGPLGFLGFPYFSTHATALRMVYHILVCLAAAVGLWLVGWRLRLLWRCVLLGAFCWVASNLNPKTDLVLEACLLSWGLLCFVEVGRRLTVCALVFTGLVVLGALAKMSFLFGGALSVILLACGLWSRARRLLALGIVAGFGAGFLLGWTLAGQSLLHLGSFLANALAIVQGYNQALGWEGLDTLRHRGFLLATLAIAMVFLRTLTAVPGQWRCRGWLSAWTLSLTFMVWKHGFVHGDVFHAGFFFGFVPLLALALELFPCQRPVIGLLGQALAAVSCLLSFLTLQTFFFPPVLESMARPFLAFGGNLITLCAPGEYFRRMNGILEANRRQAQLPLCRQIIGRARADVFGQYQAYAVFNELNYRPRPVFQSPAACNDRLMGLNEQFYLSPSAPEYVLFDLTPIDRKFPPLEDARVLRDLLVNYAPVASEGTFVLLRARSSDAPRLTLVRTGVVGPSQPIDLLGYGEAELWLEIALEPSFVGWLREFFYRPPIVRLAAWRSPAQDLIIRRRAPAAMLTAGFVASPLLTRNQDMLDLYNGNVSTRPAAYSVELLKGEERYWQTNIRYRIYRIENLAYR
jgi:hypothetical protein